MNNLSMALALPSSYPSSEGTSGIQNSSLPDDEAMTADVEIEVIV
jgi:hypothetical protein